MGKNNDHFLYTQTISSRLCYFTEEYLVFHAQSNERKLQVFEKHKNKDTQKGFYCFRHMLFAEVRHLDLTHDTAKVQIFFLTVFNP